jgi:RNA polymerase primary sigma factor
MTSEQEKLVEDNLYFAQFVAKRYHGLMEWDDLVAAAYLGLVLAAETYDASRGVKFISYAVYYIRNELRKALEENRLVAVPRNVSGPLWAARKGDPDQTPAEVAVASGLPITRVHAASYEQVDIDAPLEGGRTIAATLGGHDGDMDRADTIMDVEVLLAALSPREALVIRKRFGLDDEGEYTLQEIGSMIGTTKEAVRQIEKRALQRLKKGACVSSAEGQATVALGYSRWRAREAVRA